MSAIIRFDILDRSLASRHHILRFSQFPNSEHVGCSKYISQAHGHRSYRRNCVWVLCLWGYGIWHCTETQRKEETHGGTTRACEP